MILGIVFLCGAAVGVAAYRWGCRKASRFMSRG